MVVNNKIQTDLVDSPLKNDKKHRLKQRFDVQRKLGQGTYGKVQLAVNRETGQEVAVKTIKKVKIESEQDLIRIRREIQIMSSIQHPHIIHIYEVFENKDKIVLVMQFACGGELYDYLSEKKILSDLEARRIFRQIAAAVYYCHKNKICHRDLKLENILLDERGNAKIADFGLSNVFDEKHLLKTYCGSPLYASPEIVKGVPYCGPEVDCWSMGVLLYTLVYGAMPFDGSNFKKLVTQISEGDYFEPKKKSNATELIHRLLTVCPEKRATIVDICTDYWVNLGYEHSLLQVAEDMANLTPVRLDLLLALAPGSPIPERDVFQEESDTDAHHQDQVSEKETPDEEDDEDDDYNADTAANSFAFMKGSRASQLSISSPNLLDAIEGAYEDDDGNEFLPADMAAALQGDNPKRMAERSFGASLARISSLAHRSKKPRKSESSEPVNNQEPEKAQQNESEKSAEEKCGASKKVYGLGGPKGNAQKSTSRDKLTSVSNPTVPPTTSKSQDKLLPPDDVKCEDVTKSDVPLQQQKSELDCAKASVRKDSLSGSKVLETACLLQKRSSITPQDESSDVKKVGRPPGKIIIPKTFDSPQSTPSPKTSTDKKISQADVVVGNQSPRQSSDDLKSDCESQKEQPSGNPKSPVEDINKNVLSNSDSSISSQPTLISEEKKNMAKGILKKGIAKAQLLERRMSKQSSVDSDVSTPPVSVVGTPEPGPSFFKIPKPYEKETPKMMESKAEIKLSSAKTASSTLKNESACSQKAPLWEAAHLGDRKLQEKNLNWSAISSTIDSEMSGWREQMEESLKRLSPEDERVSHSLAKMEDDKPLVPIARSYKKFTFTKDGACITETKKIYTTPGADGSWTKVEKKTKITTRPGNAEEFEKFRDLHLRNDSPLTRSDSQSSSGSNDKYDDIFDSWTGDTMMCNMRKMNNMFQRFSHDPFLRKERRRNPFRFFRRTESERNERERKKYELRNGRSVDKDSSENEEDYDVHFDDTNAVVYGSQGLWQLLRSANRGLPGRVTIQQEPVSYTRSVSQDRSESKFGANWKRSNSRASSGYNTGTRSQSRDRTESPRERVLRFVFESPSDEPSKEHCAKGSPLRPAVEKFSVKRNPRRDSGVGSDGYESEYSVRQCPSDELSKAGRVSSMSSIHTGGRQDMIRNFMKSWSKELSSPPMTPTTLGNPKEQMEAFTENRKNRVEQWLDTNEEYPFSCPYSDFMSKNPKQPNASQSSTTYATMRPREYLRYNRSSSDKLADYDAEYFPFEDGHRAKNVHVITKDMPPGEANKARFRNLAYSPVSEESSKESHSLHHSDSSNSSMHHINFTFSDGRVTSSHTPPHSATRYVKTFTSSKDGQVPSELPSTNVKFEQVSRGQPVVQMRVSFNKPGRENHLPSQSPPSSAGLWEQHSSPLPSRQEPPVRQVSPLPGIRTFSTEIAHSVGGTEKKPSRISLECDVTTSKNSPHGSQTGKNSPYKASCDGIWNVACPQTCMTNDSKPTNINMNELRVCSEPSNYASGHSPNNITHFLPLKNEYDSVQEQSSNSISNGANTPDSLEDLTFEQILPDYINQGQKDLKDSVKQEEKSQQANLCSEFQLEIKPLGVLWNNCNAKSETEPEELCDLPENVSFMTCSRSESIPPPDDFCDDSESLQQKCIENTSPGVGSIWEQKNATTFDLLRNLLCDEGLENFNSTKCMLESPDTKHIKNCTKGTGNVTSCTKNPVVENHFAVIDELERINSGDNFHRMMPSLMDDLQSPKEVLRQAMKICKSYEN